VLARALFVADVFAAVLVCSTVAALLGTDSPGTITMTVGAAALWPAVSFTLGLYRTDDLRSWASGLPAVPKLMVGAIALSWPLYALASLVGAADTVLVAALTSVLILAVSFSTRMVARLLVRRRGEFRQRTVIIGSGLVAETLISKMRNNDQFGLVCAGIIDDHPHTAGVIAHDVPYLGGFDALEEIIQSGCVDRVIIAFTRANHEQLLRSIRACRDHGVALDIVPRLFDFLDGVSAVEYLGGMPLMSIGMPRLSTPARFAKRTLDIVLSTAVLVAFSPAILTIAALIKLESRGPVLFRQSRVGRHGRPFSVLKFRSMVSDAEQRKQALAEENDVNDGVMFKIRRDPRITRVGRYLRRTSLDELPQLINVLRGDMSLVGPRPIIPEEAAALTDPWQARRLELRPGITGPWQTSGRSHSTFDEMVRLDYQYVVGWSLARDLEILMATVPVVVSGRGAF
jgi:exopolysaccharide biosynthesis polyprenyl glycosylphosphotransferase